MMKKLGVFLALLLSMGLVTGSACAGQVTLQIAYENHPGEPVDLACNEWKRLIELESGGTMKVEIFPSSQLGTKNDLMDQMIAGDSIITLADGSFYAERGVPDFDIMVAPYIADNYEQLFRLFKSDWFEEQCDQLQKNGIKVLTANWVYGDRHILTTRPIRKLSDMAGLKIRTPNSIMFISTFEALGAAPTPLPLGDVYTALQQGVVDGLENPLPVLYNGKFQEVAKYLTLTKHISITTSWICGTIFFDSLTPDQQRILLETGDKAGLFNNDAVAKATAETIDLFKNEGVEIIEVDLADFRDAAAKIYQDPKVVGKWTPGLYDKVKALMGK